MENIRDFYNKHVYDYLLISFVKDSEETTTTSTSNGQVADLRTEAVPPSTPQSSTSSLPINIHCNNFNETHLRQDFQQPASLKTKEIATTSEKQESISTPSISATEFTAPEVTIHAHKAKELAETALDARPSKRNSEINWAILQNFKLPTNLENLSIIDLITQLVVLFDDPHEKTLFGDILNELEQGKKISDQLRERAKQITNLSLPHFPNQKKHIVEILNLFSNVESLCCSEMSYDAVIMLKLIKSLNYLPSTLSSLDFSCNASIGYDAMFSNDDSIAPIVQLKNIRVLNLHNCTNITDKDISHLTQLSDLRSLDLSDCLSITDEALDSIARLENLEYLNLARCSNITDNGIAKIAELKRLKNLNIASCYKITDNALINISRLTSLTHLNLACCNKITDTGLNNLIELTNLQNLDLTQCENITDTGVGCIAKLGNLQYLGLSGCKNITDKGLDTLTQLQNLQHLDISCCIKITGDGVLDMLVEELEKLRLLILNGCPNIKPNEMSDIAVTTQGRPLKIEKIW